MGRLIQIAASTLLSGGILNHGSLGGYISNATRLALGMGLAELQDGQVHYFSRHHDLLKRAAIQVASQTAYGLLRSYPRYLKYWEQQVRDKYLQTQSQSSLANKTGQYYQLIREQQAVAQKKNHIDSIVGRTVADFLELSISEEGKYYDNSECKVLPNSRYGLVTFVDLGPQVQVSSRNNILLTRVQGRDYTRKEYISGGDLEITINGKITSKYPDVYPEAEVSKFIRLVQYKGVIDCDNTVLRQFNISRLIIQGYTLQPTDCRNVQPYSLNCVAVEPSEALEPNFKESALAECEDPVAKTIFQMLSYCKVYQFHDSSTEGPLRQACPVETANYLQSHGNNLPSFLLFLRENYKDAYNRIVDYVRDVVPQFQDFYLEPVGGIISLRWIDNSATDYRFNAYQFSDGSIRFIALAALLLQPAQTMPNVIILDEPELGLHPYAISQLAEMIKDASIHAQVIIATQSKDLVDHFDIGDISVVEMNKETQATSVTHLDAKEYHLWLQNYTVSELWDKNIIGGRPV